MAPELSGEAQERPPEGKRRYPSTLGGLVYMVVALVTAAGLLIVVIGPWRRGIGVIGVGLLAGAAARAVLPSAQAGMLGVRSRWFDVTVMTAVGMVLLVLAATIPNQP